MKGWLDMDATTYVAIRAGVISKDYPTVNVGIITPKSLRASYAFIPDSLPSRISLSLVIQVRSY